MKLLVTGRYVDLDFGTVTPVKLSAQFRTEEIARSAASAIATAAGIMRYSVYSAEDGESREVIVPNERVRRMRRRAAKRQMGNGPIVRRVRQVERGGGQMQMMLEKTRRK